MEVTKTYITIMSSGTNFNKVLEKLDEAMNNVVTKGGEIQGGVSVDSIVIGSAVHFTATVLTVYTEEKPNKL